MMNSVNAINNQQSFGALHVIKGHPRMIRSITTSLEKELPKGEAFIGRLGEERIRIATGTTGQVTPLDERIGEIVDKVTAQPSSVQNEPLSYYIHPSFLYGDKTVNHGKVQLLIPATHGGAPTGVETYAANSGKLIGYRGVSGI